MLLLVPTTALAGFLSGMVGIGGGLFVLPLLVLLLGCPTHIAIGVTTAYVGIVALPAFLRHLIGGDPFQVWLALPLAAVTLAGNRVGPMISLGTGVRTLRVILAIILLGLALWMIVNAFTAL